METHTDDNVGLGGVPFSVGWLFLIFATVTTLDIQYLFRSTLPCGLLGLIFLALAKRWWLKPVDDDGEFWRQ